MIGTGALLPYIGCPLVLDGGARGEENVGAPHKQRDRQSNRRIYFEPIPTKSWGSAGKTVLYRHKHSIRSQSVHAVTVKY